jgi:hypothetical protein
LPLLPEQRALSVVFQDRAQFAHGLVASFRIPIVFYGDGNRFRNFSRLEIRVRGPLR